MRRKVIQLAGKTFVISLPSTWVREWGVKKGEEIELTENGPRLIVSTAQPRELKKRSVDLTSANDRVMRWVLSSLHKKGFDEIEITSNQKQGAIVDEMLKDLFLGFAVVHRSGSRSIIRSLSKELDDQFEVILRRAFLVTLNMAEECARLAKEGKQEELQGLLALEKVNNQLTNFCERILNKRGSNDPTTTNFLYVIVWNLEKICDEYKYLCEHASKNKLEKSTVALLEKVNDSVRSYYELFYRFDLKRLTELADQYKNLRKDIESQLNKGKDAIPLTYLHHIVLKTADFSASTFALH